MSNLTYEQSKAYAFKLIIILAAVTVLEVLVALVGKGYIGGMHWPHWIMALLMIGMSAFKAYSIVKEYMHLGHEVKAMGMTIVLPTLLLVWAIIAFLWEGAFWNARRDDAKGVPADKAYVSPVKAPAVAPQDTVKLDTMKLNAPAHAPAPAPH